MLQRMNSDLQWGRISGSFGELLSTSGEEEAGSVTRSSQSKMEREGSSPQTLQSLYLVYKNEPGRLKGGKGAKRQAILLVPKHLQGGVSLLSQGTGLL